MSKRKGFNFYASYFEVYMELSDKDKVLFMDALLQKQFNGITPTDLKGMSKFAYISQKHSIEQQVKGWEDKTKQKLTPTQGGLSTPTVQVQEKEKEKEEEEEKGQHHEIKNYHEYVYKCFDLCLKHFDKHLHPKTDKQKDNWLSTIDKLRRLDKIQYKTIVEIVEKTRANDFWAKNFLSLTKLRKKNNEGIMYVIVFNENIKSNEKQGNNSNNGTGVSDAYLRKLREDMES